MASYKDAQKAAADHNRANKEAREKDPNILEEPAAPEEWPLGPEKHAEGLAYMNSGEKKPDKPAAPSKPLPPDPSAGKCPGGRTASPEYLIWATRALDDESFATLYRERAQELTDRFRDRPDLAATLDRLVPLIED